VWNVSAKYHSAQWEKERATMIAHALETTQQRQDLADKIGKSLEDKLKALNVPQTIIHQKVIRETTKEPVYTQCLTTPAGVQLIDEALSNQ
jgi:DNA repair ATPase RecN